METYRNGVHPEMVNFGSGQGRSDFSRFVELPDGFTALRVETGGAAELRRGFQKSENAVPGQKMPFSDRH
jgi:hypothetical protein